MTSIRLQSRQISRLHLYHVLHAVRVARRPLSRAQIGEHTGLSQPAVSSLTRRLLDREALIEVGVRSSSSVGRRERELTLNPDHVFVVGIKVWLHQVSLSLVDFAGQVRSVQHIGLDLPQPATTLVHTLVAAIRTALDPLDAPLRQRVSGVGVALPGFIDSMRGDVHWSAILTPGPEPEPLALAQALSEALKLPVFIENDANILALSEQWFGLAAGVSNLAVVTLEHGLGLGLVLNGELYRGRAGMAAELAHLQVVDGDAALACRCGKRGCLETLVTHDALWRAAQACGVLPPSAQTPSYATVLETFEYLVGLARGGDARARAIFERHGRLLGQWLGNVVNLFAPQWLIVDGGGVVAADLFEAALREAMSEALIPPHRGQVELLIRRRGDDDWARGATSLVLQRLDESAAILESVSRHSVETDIAGRRLGD